MLPEIAREELAKTFESVAMDLLNRAGIDEPPVDAFGVARALGITVAIDDRQRGRARSVRLRGYRNCRPHQAILLHSDPRAERRQWAIAHEIGEQAAYRVFGLLSVDPRETAAGTREMVANHLASHLLLPGTWFSADAGRCDWDLIELKHRYRTASHELIARRMLELPPPVIMSIFDHARITFRSTNARGRVPPLSQWEMQCWHSVHNRNRPQRSSNGLQSVQGWPVHESGWKREILRTEVEVEI